jgi:hypothetical protein
MESNQTQQENVSLVTLSPSHFVLSGNSRNRRKQLRALYRKYKYVQAYQWGTTGYRINEYLAWN